MTSHASFWEAVVGAVQSLRGSKLRSFLTLLGIILATATLIAVMSVILSLIHISFGSMARRKNSTRSTT